MGNIFSGADRYRNLIINWRIPLVLGITYMLIGIFVLFESTDSYIVLSLALALMVLVSGFLEIYLSLKTPPTCGKGWLLSAGIIEILLSILLFVLPDIMITVLPFILGFWLMFRGYTTIGFASDMMSYRIKGAEWILALAILVVLCSFFILSNPFFGLGETVTWIGLSLILAGGVSIVHALHLHRLRFYLP